MTINYQKFNQVLSDNSDKLVEYYLPNGQKIHGHYHITDIGSVTANFIDCGGQVRSEQHVQIQLWLGADLDHTLTAQKSQSIFKRSQAVLNLLDDLENSAVLIEYKTDLVALYQLGKADVTADRVKFYLQDRTTQCLAALRHEQEIADGQVTNCCSSAEKTDKAQRCC